MKRIMLAVVCLVHFGILLNSCKKEIIYVDKETPIVDTVEAKIRSFSLSAALNQDYLNEDIAFSIQADVITARIPFYTDLKKLKVSFETSGGSLFVDGVKQTSGESINDFSKPVSYKLLDAKGIIKEFTVKLINFTGLPVIKIYTEGNKQITSKDDYLNADISIDGAGELQNFQGKMKIKGRGNSTWSFPKKPYKMKFDTKQSLLGRGADKEWVLLANYNDKSALRTDAAFFMGTQSLLEWTPRANFVELFVNDIYAGSYQLSESVKISDSRVDVTDDGYLLEVDQLNRLEAGDVYMKTKRILLNIKEPEVTTNDEKYNYIKGYLNDAEDALYGPNFKDDVIGYKKYLDVESFVDWYLINEIAKNNDAVFESSCFMNLKPGGKLKMGPIWDFDIAFGNINYNNNQVAEGFWVKNSVWIKRLFEDPEFVAAVKTRFAHFKANKPALLDNINKKSVMLKWSAWENNNKWNTFYNNTNMTYAAMGSYNNEVQYLKDWINKRFDWLDVEFQKL